MCVAGTFDLGLHGCACGYALNDLASARTLWGAVGARHGLLVPRHVLVPNSSELAWRQTLSCFPAQPRLRDFACREFPLRQALTPRGRLASMDE
jgi:hypothetical protein